MNPASEPDEWLMGQVALGKREFLDKLVRRYASPLLTFIERMTGDRHKSEEVFQETFLSVWAKRHQYKFPKPFRSWLFAIAANKCREDYRRVAGKRPQSLDDDLALAPADRGPAPADTAIRAETAAVVAQAVELLPPAQRAVVVLRVWNELSYAEIAEITGRNEGTVRSNMHHGLAAMRRYLEPRLC